MWPNFATGQKRRQIDPAILSMRELMGAEPRHVRTRLQPGVRFPTGMRPGRRRAQGMDLDSIGPYVPGDEVRWIDWRATARTGRAQMKRFLAESHLARMLIVDLRGHMMFGSGTHPMAKVASLLAANLTWEAVALQEPVGLVALPSLATVPPRRGRGHALFLFKKLCDAYAAAVDVQDAGPEEVMTQAVDIASGHLGTGDEICVFSDFGATDAALSAKVKSLSGIRRFRAIPIEDSLLYDGVAGGRYPYQTQQNPQRNLAAVSSARAKRHKEEVENLRKLLRRRLINDGWRITESTRNAALAPGVAR